MSIRRVLSFIFLVLLFVSSGFCQQPGKKPAEAAADHSDEPYVFESYRAVLKFENDGTGMRETSARVRVQSEAGVQRLGQLIFGYSSANESMEMNYVRVRRADGSVVSAAPDAVQDLPGAVVREAPVYSDYREKHITVPGLRPGETLEYSIVTRLRTALVPGHFWLEYEFEKQVIVLNEELEVSVPREREIKLKTEPGFEPTISQQGDRRIYRWKSSHLKRESEEEKKKKKARKAPLVPDVQLTTLRNWDDLGRWYAELQRDRVAPTPAIRARAAELVRGRNSELEKIEALYDFVAKNFRYISLSFGVGRYQPHAAGDILGNQYGDCKDKHTLLAALLEAVGIHAEPALINTQRKLDPALPSPSQFNHMITAIPQAKGYLWLDTTTEVAPFRLLAASLRGKQALVIAADGRAKLVETPAEPPFPNSQLVGIDAKVSDLGKLEATVRFTLRGDNELALRTAFRRTSSNQWKQLAQALNYFYGLAGEASEVKPGDPADTRGPYHLEYQVTQASYVDWSSRQSQPTLFLPAMGLPEADSDNTTEPIQLNPEEVTLRLKLELPARYSVRPAVPVSITRDYGEYRSSYRVEGSTVMAERTLITRASELPAARTGDYLAFRRAVRSDEEQKLSVDLGTAGPPSLPTTAKTEDLFEAGMAALRNRNFEAAQELLQRVVSQEPKHKEAWNELGRAYLAMSKYEEAIRCFRQQVEINPYHESAYNNLGFVYWRQQKYETAAGSFRKQLEVNPLDNFAHGSLGLMYCEWRKFAEAVPELEQAISLRPDNPAYQVGLGQAYLNLNQPEKALKAFDRAVEIAPAPMVWNNIAYELSKHNVHLERAQQYAESAVAATAAVLRNVTLERVRVEDLAEVSGLAAYWDTLGWIHFQKGELEQAEKYVRASWSLEQHSEVGDHLGQIYEKRGQKQRAIEALALALAASRPVPETRPRLAALLGGDQLVDPMVNKLRGELAAQRTLKAGPLLKESAEAEFFVLLGPGAKVEEVKFIRGSEKLRGFTSVLQAASYPAAFPDETPTKIVRRGVLSCAGAGGDCSFVLLSPDMVRSVN